MSEEIKKKQINVAQTVEFNHCLYTYSHAKHNVLVYEYQPTVEWGGEYSDGGILIVEYRPEKREKERYYVLHSLNIWGGSGKFTHSNLKQLCAKRGNRFAIPRKDE